MNGQELAKRALDQISQVKANAKRIVGLVKEAGRITGYQLSDNSIVEKQQAVDVSGVGKADGIGDHRGQGDTDDHGHQLEHLTHARQSDKRASKISRSPLRLMKGTVNCYPRMSWLQNKSNFRKNIGNYHTFANQLIRFLFQKVCP